MDKKMEILITFANLSESKATISSESLSNIRLILSLFKEEIISIDEFDQEVENLIDDGYLSKSKTEEFNVTPRGLALVKSIGKNVLGESEYNRLSRSILDYSNSKGKSDYVKVLGDRLHTLQQAQINKTKSADPNSIHPLGILMKIQYKIEQLFTVNFDLTDNLIKEDSIFESERKNLQKKLSRQYSVPMIVSRSGKTLQITGPIKIESVPFFDTTLAFSKCYPIDRRKIPQWNNLILYSFIENALRKIGFFASGQFTFTNYSRCSPHDNFVAYKEYDAIKISFFDLDNDSVFVFIESYKSIFYSLLDFITDCLKRGDSHDAIFSKIKKLKLRVIPFGAKISFTDVVWDKNLKHEKIPDTSKTYCEYWKDTHGIEITHPIQPIIVTQSYDRALSYPSEMVQLDRNSVEDAYGHIPKRKPRYEDLNERYERIEHIFENFASFRDENSEKFLALDSVQNSPPLKTLIDLKGFKETIQISPPLLEFSKGAFSIEPLDAFNSEFGPVCGKKKLEITHFLTPSSINDRQIDFFCDTLNRAFFNYNFGTISKSPNVKIKKYDSITNLHTLENKVREFEPTNNPNAIGIAIIPEGDDSYYYALKKIFPVKTGTRLQIVKKTSFDKILSSNFPGLKLLTMNILIKSLKTGEAVWTLANSAGLSKEKTLFVGIGFSQNPHQGKISKCATVMHDSHGAKITWKVFATPQQGRTIDAIWFENLLNRIQDIVDIEKPIRIVFYRTGELFPKEMDALQIAIKKCQWLDPIKLSFISIIDASNCRFFKSTDKKINLPAGCGIIINDKEAFLSTSNFDNRGLRQGTVMPVRIRLELGDDQIKNILMEYHDLTYLNWQAPFTTAKHPLVVTIANRFADLTKEGVPAENTFYLDL